MLNSFTKVKIYYGQFTTENVTSSESKTSFAHFNFFLCPCLHNYYTFGKKIYSNL